MAENEKMPAQRRYHNDRVAHVGDLVLAKIGNEPVCAGFVRAVSGDIRDGRLLLGMVQLGTRIVEAADCLLAEDAWLGHEIEHAIRLYTSADLFHPNTAEAIKTLIRSLDCVGTEGGKATTEVLKP